MAIGWPDRAGEREGLCSDERLGDRLKSFFDGVTEGPIPDRLVQLAAALEAKMAQDEMRRSSTGRQV